MRTVLQFQAAFSTVCRRIADGVRDFAASAGWRLHVIPYANAAEREDDPFGNVIDAAGIAALLDEWQPDGCVIQWSSLWPDLAQAIPGIPCVTTDNPHAANAVCFDNAAIGRAAADELLRLSPASCAYLSMHRPLYWCAERTAAFAASMRSQGVRVVDLGDAGDSVNAVSSRLVEALLRMPKPCGLFAVNDLVARRAFEAAEAAGLNVPFDVAIVGADDDESICEGPGVTLTSIRPDFRRLGYEAASLLARLMARASAAPVEGRKSKVESPGAEGGRVSPRAAGAENGTLPILRVGGATIVRRASSRRLLRNDPLAAAVLEDIRLNFADSITAASLARRRNVCLRTLERRFQSATGRTVGREIADARFRAAQAMLAAKERRAIDAIANFCGYESDSSLRKAFRARLGLSPSAWRAAERKRRDRK